MCISTGNSDSIFFLGVMPLLELRNLTKIKDTTHVLKTVRQNNHRMKSHLSFDWMVIKWWLNCDWMVTGKVDFSHHSFPIQSTEWQAHFNDLFFEKQNYAQRGSNTGCTNQSESKFFYVLLRESMLTIRPWRPLESLMNI